MNLFIYCCGGFGREVADIAHRTNSAHGRWNRIAFLDDALEQGSLDGIEVYHLDTALHRFGRDTMEAVVATGEPFVRKVLAESLDAHSVPLASLIDSNAVISPSANIGAGAIVFPGCYVSSMATLGRNVAMIAGSLVGHHSCVGDHCFLSGHVNVGGGCSIGSTSYLGMGSQVKERTRIGKRTIVGMGSVVFADVPDEVIALGNPCRAMRPNTAKRVFNFK